MNDYHFFTIEPECKTCTKSATPSLGAAIGGSVGAIAVIAFVILAIFIYNRYILTDI